MPPFVLKVNCNLECINKVIRSSFDSLVNKLWPVHSSKWAIPPHYWLNKEHDGSEENNCAVYVVSFLAGTYHRVLQFHRQALVARHLYHLGVENNPCTIVFDPSVLTIVSLEQDSPGFSDHRMTNRNGRGLSGESTRKELRSVWSDRSWSQRREEQRSLMFNRKLQEVPHLTKIKDDLSLEVTGGAYKISNLPSLPHL